MRPLTGRERESAALTEALDLALDGAGGVATLSGEPGIGKTTLARELGQIATGRGVPVLWGRGVEFGAPPFWPWLQVLRARAEAVGDAELRADAGWGAADLVRLAPELGPRLLVEPSPTEQDRPRLFDAFGTLLRTAGSRAGLLVILDDLHWADHASRRLLEHVADELVSSRVLVVVAYRPTEGGADDAVGDLDAVSAIARIRLRGLPVPAVHHKLTSATGVTATVALSARIHKLTGGNPLFVSELARLLAEDIAVGKPIDDAWPHEVPPTVRALIRRRLRRLAPSTQAVLHAAAVFGREFPIAVIAAMVRAPAMACLDALEEAQSAGLVEPGGVPGRQRFVHALIRDAVEADLPATDQVRLHRAAAEALEAAVDREVQPSVVARHHAAAELALPANRRDPAAGLRAADWAARAADAAMRSSAWEEAARLRRLALDLGGAAMDDIDRCHLFLDLGRALQRSGELAACLAASLQAAELARSMSRPDLLAEAALVVQGVGDPDLSRALQRLAEEALAAVGEGPATTRSRLLAQLAETHLYQHDHARADERSRESLIEAEAAGDRETLLIALHGRRLATLSPDRTGETLALADRVLELASDRAEDIRHAFWAHVWRIQAWLMTGQLDLIARELEPLAECAEELREPLCTAHLLRLRAILASARGQFAHALELAERGQAAFLRTGQAAAAAQHAGFRCSVARFVGYPPDLADSLSVPPDAAGAFAELGRTRSALSLAGAGRGGEAVAEYGRLEPVTEWRLPDYLQVTGWSLRLRAAVTLGVLPDVAVLVDLLSGHRGLHAGGGLSYDGPVELALGTGSAALGRLDAAQPDLTVALDWSRTQNAKPFRAETAVELAGVLARRAGAGDTHDAKVLLDEADMIAAELGMAPVAARVRRLRAGLGVGRSSPSPLTTREAQVARLVARGMTNRQIAETLVLSERTAGNHVQHILTKLGLDNRTQIAAWVATDPTRAVE